jgi:ribosomal protein S18 acetylase RimI-like enzyme
MCYGLTQGSPVSAWVETPPLPKRGPGAPRPTVGGESPLLEPASAVRVGQMSAITIEPATELDDELLEAFGRLIPQLSRSAGLSADLLRRLLAHDATTLLLARFEGRLVGALTLVIYPLPTGLRAHIDDVVVDDSARGLGVGAALVQAALAAAEQQGVRTVELTSRPGRDAAIRLYTKLGFVQRDSHLYRYQPAQANPTQPAQAAPARADPAQADPAQTVVSQPAVVSQPGSAR